LRNLAYTFAGLGAISIARNANGWTSELAPVGTWLRRVVLREEEAAPRSGTPGADTDGDGSADGDGGAREATEEVRPLAGVGS
jgi:hypothetical protein